MLNMEFVAVGKLSGMKVLITGAAGQLGQDLQELFEAECIEYIPTDFAQGYTNAGNLENLASLTQEQKEKFKLIKDDICNSELVEYIFQEYDVDGAVSFTAESHADRSMLNG